MAPFCLLPLLAVLAFQETPTPTRVPRGPERGQAGALGRPEVTTMYLHTDAFPQGGLIPRPFTGDGGDRSPALTWSGAPSATRAFALVMDDPDAPRGLWTHWIVYGLDASAHALPEGLLPPVPGLRQGRNTGGQMGYMGPAPPPGRPHRYVFHLYALSNPLDLAPGADRAAFDRAIRGRVLAEATWMGKYGR